MASTDVTTPQIALREAEQEARKIARSFGHDIHPIPAELPRTRGVCKICGWSIRLRIRARDDGGWYAEFEYTTGRCRR